MAHLSPKVVCGFSMCFFIVLVCSEPLIGLQVSRVTMNFKPCWAIRVPFVFVNGLIDVSLLLLLLPACV